MSSGYAGLWLSKSVEEWGGVKSLFRLAESRPFFLFIILTAPSHTQGKRVSSSDDPFHEWTWVWCSLSFSYSFSRLTCFAERRRPHHGFPRIISLHKIITVFLLTTHTIFFIRCSRLVKIFHLLTLYRRRELGQGPRAFAEVETSMYCVHPVFSERAEVNYIPFLRASAFDNLAVFEKRSFISSGTAFFALRAWYTHFSISPSPVSVIADKSYVYPIDHLFILLTRSARAVTQMMMM